MNIGIAGLTNEIAENKEGEERAKLRQWMQENTKLPDILESQIKDDDWTYVIEKTLEFIAGYFNRIRMEIKTGQKSTYGAALDLAAGLETYGTKDQYQKVKEELIDLAITNEYDVTKQR